LFLNLYRCIHYAIVFIVLNFSVPEANGQKYTVERQALGKIKDSRLQELSGLISSFLYPNMFWVHNDSGDMSRIFLLDDKAQLKAVYTLAGVHTKDTEDIARFQRDGKSFLVLADIGDNRALREDIKIYIFKEPEWNRGQSEYIISEEAIHTIRLKYADKPRDAEAMFVDPVDGNGYIIAKRDLNVGVYPVVFNDRDSTQILKPVVNLPLTFITSADISDDGHEVLLKNLTHVFLWKRKNHEPIKSLFARSFEQLSYDPEPQGEAICFGMENSVFYTISERPLGLDSYLYRYKIRPIK